MSANNVRRDDLILGGVALLLLINLLELPWYEKGGGTVSGITLPSVSNTATGSPGSILGVFAVLATLVLLLDLVFLFLSPDTKLPAISDNRSFTRFVLAIATAVLLAVKFLLNLTLIGNLGVGFWLAIPLTAALVILATQARRDESEKERAERAQVISQREQEAKKKEEEEAEEEEQGSQQGEGWAPGDQDEQSAEESRSERENEARSEAGDAGRSKSEPAAERQAGDHSRSEAAAERQSGDHSRSEPAAEQQSGDHSRSEPAAERQSGDHSRSESDSEQSSETAESWGQPTS